MQTAVVKKQGIAGLILWILLLSGCTTYTTIIAKKEVAAIPEDRYEQIIKLYNAEGAPENSLAGLVFIKKGAKVCTDYPREVTLKSLDSLDMMEKYAYKYFSLYAIESGGTIFGYYAIPLENRVLIYKNSKDDEDCIFKLVVIEPQHQGGMGRMPGIHHGVK